MNGTGISIDQAVIFSISVFSYSAKASLSFGYATVVRTQLTLDFSSLQRSEIRRKLCLDEPFLRHLCMGGFRKAE
jgi:hypothetical protein